MTKRLLIPALALCALALAASCGGDRTSRADDTTRYTAPPDVGGCVFTYVKASVFTFNEAETGRLIDGATVPVETIQDAFWISNQPVTPALYKRYFPDKDYPENGLSYDDAEKLLDRIHNVTGVALFLPSEAEYEAAAKAGILGCGKSDELLARDPWTERPLPEGYVADPFVTRGNPAPNGDQVTLRSLYERKPTERYRRRQANKAYLVARAPSDMETVGLLTRAMDLTAPETPEASDGKSETVKIDGAAFDMIPVAGGNATLGATPEQEEYADADENPVREVILKDFKISRTEVTIDQWEAVMGTLPYGNDRRYPGFAVGNVSYFDAVEFTLRLRELTGRPFRIPSEDEWEYAARGGRKTRHYVFSGSSNSVEVAVCARKNKKGESVYHHPMNAGSLKANELGICDMSGNMWEWCRTAHPDGGAVQKGGSYKSLNTACRVSNRQCMTPEKKKETFGFRIAL